MVGARGWSTNGVSFPTRAAGVFQREATTRPLVPAKVLTLEHLD